MVSPEAQKFISNNQTTSKYPLHKKIANLFVMTSIVLVVVTGYISLRVYFDNTIKDKRQNAWDCASTLAKSINPSQVDGFLKFRANAPGYTETQELFTKIQECSHNVSRLYAQKFEPNGSIYIFDTNREAFYQPGDLVPYDAHLAKEAESFIDGIYSRYYEHNSLFKWNYTYYYPVLDDSGKCVCYVCADATLNYFKEYMANFAMRVLLIMAGFFIVLFLTPSGQLEMTFRIPSVLLLPVLTVFRMYHQIRKSLKKTLKLSARLIFTARTKYRHCTMQSVA